MRVGIITESFNTACSASSCLCVRNKFSVCVNYRATFTRNDGWSATLVRAYSPPYLIYILTYLAFIVKTINYLSDSPFNWRWSRPVDRSFACRAIIAKCASSACINTSTFAFRLPKFSTKGSSTMSSSSSGWDCKSKKLTNHSQLFFLDSIVIGQFLTASPTTVTAHCRRRFRFVAVAFHPRVNVDRRIISWKSWHKICSKLTMVWIRYERN